MPAETDFARCIALYKRHDVAFIAQLVGDTPVEVCRVLRRERALRDIQACEASFIQERFGVWPDQEIASHLGLSATQLDQFVRRHELVRARRDEPLTAETCAAKTRWLVEERLRLLVDVQLPRRIRGQDFLDNHLHAVIAYATREKAKCATGRHFSACAFLVRLAYPDRFKPWQFRHAKTNDYFSGVKGRKRLLDALLPFAVETAGSLAALPLALRTNGFLNTRCLQDHGLGAHWWRRHWRTKEEMLEALARHAGIEPPGRRGNLTRPRARARLEAASIDTGRCAVPGCLIAGSGEVQFHHIVRKTTRVIRGFDVHCAENLIPLCRHHHGIADRFRRRDYDISTPATLRTQLLAKLG
ncbi:HNH endonuclease signature motif containing protein [Falsiroseomonas sp. HC035]|uniref:HNH endonuclease signature motif containing protein n=1 Tax=Falsiroseomonas sp. HC035 TaxID=3390999 RepID=UPI003D311952